MNKLFSKNNQPITLYRNPKSGHCHRVELLLALLHLPYETVDLDMANGEHKSPAYLKLNSLGQVPAINDNGIILSDSNAIITYLANQYAASESLVGENPVEKAQIQRWLSIAAGEIASGPCAARLVTVFGAGLDHETAKQKAHALFEVMNKELADKEFLVSERLTLADIAGYSYIAHAPEGGVGLAQYPHIRKWLSNVEAQNGFIGMATSPILAD